MIAWVLLGISLAGYFAAWRLHLGVVKRTILLAQAAFQQATDTIATEHESLRLRTTELNNEIAHWKEMAIEAEAARQRYFVKISEVTTERDIWIKKCTDESIGHGNAQNLMMRTIDEMGQVLRAKGLNFKMPPVLQAVREEFVQVHEAPARQTLEDMVQGSRTQITEVPPVELGLKSNGL